MRDGWRKRSLGEVLQLNYGKPLPKEDRDMEGIYPAYGANGVKARTNKYYFDRPSIIIGRKGSAGEVVLSEEKFWPLDVTYFVTFDDKMYDLMFLYHCLISLQLTKLAKGVKPGINRNEVYQIEFLFPPLPEQKRIVAILDKAFEGFDRAIANTEKNLANARELFNTYVYQILNQKRASWTVSTVGDECKLMTGGTPSRSKNEYFENGDIKWLVSGDIHQQEITECEGRITQLGLENSNTKYLPVNSVMIALNGQGKTRGTVAMLRTEATCNQSLVSIFPDTPDQLLPEFLYINLQSRYDEIRKMTGDSGNDRRGLNMPLIRKIKFNYPNDVNEQRSIISRIEKLRNDIKVLETMYQQKLLSLSELKQSLLHKAFTGELTTDTETTIKEEAVA